MDADGGGILSVGGLGWRCGRMLQRHSALLNWQGWASADALEKGAWDGDGRLLWFQKKGHGMVADVCCGFKKGGVGWWRTSAVVSKKGRGMVVDVCWRFKKGSAVVLVSG